MLVIAEMMALAKQAGVDAEQIPAALAGGFADSKPLQITGAEMAAETFEPVKWRVKTLLKDLNMAVDLSVKQGNCRPHVRAGLAIDATARQPRLPGTRPRHFNQTLHKNRCLTLPPT